MKVKSLLAKAAKCKTQEDADKLLDTLERVFGNARPLAHLPQYNSEAYMEDDNKPFVRFELNQVSGYSDMMFSFLYSRDAMKTKLPFIACATQIFIILGSGLWSSAYALTPKEEANKCYYQDTISKVIYDKATANLQRNPNDLDSLICAGRYQNDTLKQYAASLKTLKRAEQVSLKNDERELNLIHRYLVTVSGNLPAHGSYADDYNYYTTVRNRADELNITSFKRCFAALKNNDFDSAINAAYPVWWRNTKLSEGNNCLGKASQRKGEFQKALAYFHRLELIPGGESNGLAIAQSELSALYDSLEQYDLAIDYGNKSLSEYRRLGNKRMEAVLLNDIAGIYRSQGDTNRAVVYYEQSLALETVDSEKAPTWNNLAMIYNNQGDTAKAIDYLRKALAAEKNAGNRLGAAIKQLNLGSIYTDTNDFAQAEPMLTEGLKAVQQFGAKKWEITGLQYLAWLREAQGRMDEYFNLLKQGLAIAQQTENHPKIKAITEELKKAGAL